MAALGLPSSLLPGSGGSGQQQEEREDMSPPAEDAEQQQQQQQQQQSWEIPSPGHEVGTRPVSVAFGRDAGVPLSLAARIFMRDDHADNGDDEDDDDVGGIQVSVSHPPTPAQTQTHTHTHTHTHIFAGPISRCYRFFSSENSGAAECE